MKRSNVISRVGALLLSVVVVAPLLIGCGAPVAADGTASKIGYTSALDLSYEDALGSASQLALGTLKLEGTANAITEAQAATLLPLWEALQGGELQGESEQYPALRQIEATMTEAQVSAITGLRLTSQDAQDRMEASPMEASPMETGGVTASAASSPGSGRGSFQALPRVVVALLSARSGVANEDRTQPPGAQVATQATDGESTSTTEVPALQESPAAVEAFGETGPVAVEPAAGEDSTDREAPAAEQDSVRETASPTAAGVESVVYVVQAGNSLAGIAAAYGVTVEAIAESNGIEDPNTIYVGQELIIAEPGRIPEPGTLAASAQASSAQASSAQAQGEAEAGAAPSAAQALERLADNDPGPPLTIEVSANRATQDPLVEKSQSYLVTGIVRNDGDRTYAVSSIGVTFYDAEGFRGTFDPAIRDGRIVGGEWNWHGQTEAEFAALLLAPGEEWPFRVEITAQDMASFLIHPDATATGRESAQIELSDVQMVEEGTGYVRISGTATNANAFTVKNVTVSGVLLDGNGQIVSLGSAYVLQEDIEPGDSVHFYARVAREPYANYSLYAQAERDW